MTDMAGTPGREPRWLRLSEMRKQERKERSDLLEEHNAKWRATREAFQAECAAEGHKDGGEPGDTSSRPWICFHCGAQIAEQPFLADQLQVHF